MPAEGAQVGRFLFIEGRWVDTLSPDFRKTMDKMKDEAHKQSAQIGGLVNEKMGRSMSQFNEKTEKARQMLSTFGGTLGGTAGQAVYYSGTLAYMIGRYNLAEMAIMALIAGLGALAISQMTVNKLTKEASEANKKYADEMERLNSEIKKQMRLAIGAVPSEAEIKAIKDRIDLEKRFLKLATMDAEAYHKGREEGFKLFGVRIMKHERNLAKMRLELRAAEARKAATAILEGGVEEPKGVKGGWVGEMEGAWEWEKRWEEDQKRRRAKAEQEYRRQQEFANQLYSLEEEEAKRTIALKEMVEQEKQRIAEESFHIQMELERQRVEAYHKTMMQGVQLFGELGELVTKGTMAQSAARIAAIVLEAGYQSMMEMAAGFASLGQPWLAAAHFTAAGLYAAVAANRISDVASGGGGPSASARSRAEAQGGWRDREEPRKAGTLTIHIHAGVLTGSDAGKEILRAIRENEDAWNPGRTREGLH